MTHLPAILDLAGTFAFAASGAILAVKKRLDLFGVLTLAFVAAAAGSVVRDVLIGAIPPAIITDWRYLAVALATGLLVFTRYVDVARLRSGVDLLDALGLALGAVAGAEKALAAGIDPPMAAVLGMVGGVGGGVARDMLVGRTPSILKTDLYAVSALFGASLAVTGRLLAVPAPWGSLCATASCLCLRLISIRRRWRLPVARIVLADEDQEPAMATHQGCKAYRRTNASSGSIPSPGPSGSVRKPSMGRTAEP